MFNVFLVYNQQNDKNLVFTSFFISACHFVQLTLYNYKEMYF